MVATDNAGKVAPVVDRARPGRRGLRHIGALDGLRGAAVAGVLVFHGGHLSGGYLGVDLFFVLSGYLITFLLLTEWTRARRIRLGHFWAKRARRLFPALVLALLGVAAYARYVALPEELDGIRADGFATLFYAANWHSILAGNTYFQAGLTPSPLEHTWSLAIEEQFYVVWPLVVVALLRRRAKPNTILRAALAVAAGSVALMVGLHATGLTSDNSSYLGTHTRVAAIAMGAALAAWQACHGHTRDRSTRLGLEGLALVSIVFLGVMWSMTDLGTGLVYAGGLALCGLAVTAIIAAASHPEELVVAKALAFAPLRWLGLISYGLYLYHWPIYLYLTADRTGLSSWALLALQAFTAIDVAILSYFLVERPIRYGALKGVQAKAAIPAGAALASVALLVGTVGGVSAITDTPTAQLDIASGAVPTLMLYGDSVPLVLGREGIVPLKDELGVTLANTGRIGCTPLASVGPIYLTNTSTPDTIKTDCTTSGPRWIEAFHPDVVMVQYGALTNFTLQIKGAKRDQCDPLYEAAWKRRLQEQVDVLAAEGAPVVFLTTPGVTNSFLQDRFEVQDSVARANCSNEVIRQVVRGDRRARLVDLGRFVCPRDRCIEKIDGAPVRPDGQHYRGESAKYVARWLVPRVLRAAQEGR